MSDRWDSETREFVADDRERALRQGERSLRARSTSLGLPAADDDGDGERRRADAAGRGEAGNVRPQRSTEHDAARRARERAASQRSTQPADRRLADTFAELARDLFAAETLDDVLRRIVDAAVEVIDDCDAASVTLGDGRRWWTPVASSVMAERADALQYAVGEGPCLTALDEPAVHFDATTWDRWPSLRASWPSVGAASALSCGLLRPNPPALRGALNLYADSAGGFDQESRELALVLAAHGAVAIAVAHERDAARDLRTELGERDVVRQARDVLTEREGMTAGETSGDIRSGQPERVEPVAVAGALTRILEASHLLPPDQMPELMLEVAAASGARRVRMFVIDESQRRLLPFADPTAERFDVDGTMGGRAFVSNETVEARTGDRILLWVPLRDGVDRIGVAQFELDELDDVRRGTLTRVAAMIAAELISKNQYTDLVMLARRDRPMTMAADLHHDLMRPPTFSTRQVSVTAALEPAYTVAGDAYDYAYNNGILHAAVFDAIGHDFNAGVVASVSVAAYRHARRAGQDLRAIAAHIDSAVHQHFPDAMFTTALLTTLDVAKGTFSWINSAHPPPLLIRKGRVVGTLGRTHLPPLGLAMTLTGTRSAAADTLALEPGDRLLLYTDGIIEARTPTGEDFGLERLQDFVHRAIASGTSDAEMIRRLSHAVVDQHEGRLHDDAALLMLSWHPNG